MGEPIEVTTENGTRISISTESVLEYNKFWKGKRVHGRMHVFHEGEPIIPDNLINRHYRPYELYRKVILPVVKEVLDIDDDIKFEWDQRAGCSCPCSPGFIIKGYYNNIDVLVNGMPRTVEE